MATGDILTKLLLNSSDFDNKLGKSKKEVSSFAEAGKKGFGELNAFVSKAAGVVGVAMSAYETFNKVINSSQALTDAYGRTMETAKTSVDNFVYAIFNADFTSFSAGLDNLISRAWEAYDAFDTLANVNLSANFVTSLDQVAYREAMVRARDKKLPEDQRRAALAEAQQYANNIKSASSVTDAASLRAIQSKIAAKAGLTDSSLITRGMIEGAFRIDASTTSGDERARIEKEYAEYQRKVAEIQKKYQTSEIVFQGPGMASTQTKNLPIPADALQPLQAQYAKVIAEQIALFRLADQELGSLMQVFLSSAQGKSAAAEIQNSINEVTTTLDTEAASRAAKKAAAEKAFYKKHEVRQQGIPMKELPDMKMPDKIDDSIYTGLEAEESGAILNMKMMAEEMDKVKTSADMMGGSFDVLGEVIGGAAGNMVAWVGQCADAVGAIIPLISYLQAESVMHDINATAAMKDAAAKTLAAYAGMPFVGVALAASALAAIIGLFSSLPAFAEGGIVTGPTVGLIGEAGSEAIIPLSKLNDFVESSPRDIRIVGEIRGRGKDLSVIIDNYRKVRSVK